MFINKVHPSTSEASSPRGFSDVENGEQQLKIRTRSFDPAKETHYVIVIHGTFDAPPSDGSRTWYQPPEPGEHNFCSKIGSLLDNGPITGASIWRHLPSEAPEKIPYPFFWDGSNTHQGRVAAAAKLHRLVHHIGQSDLSARVHLVAHSHGGNVMLKSIEMYMKLLEKQYSSGRINPLLLEEFRKTYVKQRELVWQWRMVSPPRIWILRLFPLLVQWRDYQGHEGHSDDLYPWGYYKWWDIVCCLGWVRQRILMQRRFVTSPVTNCLGSLVFLGTPFYVKHWHSAGILKVFLRIVVSTLVALVMLSLYIFVWEMLVYAMHPTFRQCFGLSLHIALAAGAVLAVFWLISSSLEMYQTTAFYSGNLYHNPRFGWSPAMSALVIHAGKLDEASLALSTEPAMRAYVFPALSTFIKQTPWQNLPEGPALYSNRRDWVRYVVRCFMVIVWNILFFLPALVVAGISHIIAPMITSALESLVVTISFGLSPQELSSANVYCDEMLDLPRPSQVVDHWNVQKLLAEAKTCSLAGEMLPGYEDDTVEIPEWLDPLQREDESAGNDGEYSTSVQDGETHSSEELNLPGSGSKNLRALGSRKGSRRWKSKQILEEGPSTSQADKGGFGQSSNFQEDQQVIAKTGQEASTKMHDGSSDSRIAERRVTFSEGVPKQMVTGSSGNFPSEKSEGEAEDEERLVYQFLWDDEELEKLVSESTTYRLLRADALKIDKNPRLTAAQAERELKALCVMIEARVLEATGKLDLNHGAYFRDPRILKVIANYISSRTVLSSK